MVVRDIIGLGVAFIILAGITVAIKNGGSTAQIADAFARGFEGAIRAATLQG